MLVETIQGSFIFGIMNPSDKITVYSADTLNQSFLSILVRVFRELPEAHELGLRLFKRNIKAMYRQSLFGFAWALFPPIITAALWIFLRNNNVMSMGDTGIPYPIFVLTGTMLWQIFMESIQAPIKNVTANKTMLVKINIPREALLLSGMYEVLFNMFIKLALLAVIFIVFNQPIDTHILLVPIGIFAIILCGFAIGLILTPIGVLYNDINYGLVITLPFLMYLTPVVYPKPTEGVVATIMKLNPLAVLIPETRFWFTGQPGEAMSIFWAYTVFFAFLLFLGLVVYRLALPMIIERIGS